MSKYYKAEDVISFLNMKCPKDMWEYQIADLPTIEVSDKADRPFEYFEGYEDGRKSTEVSEDCISRAYAIEVLSHVKKDEQWRTECIDNEIRLIKLLPSVVPTTEQCSLVHCKDCKYFMDNVAEDNADDECRWRTDEMPNADDYCSYGEKK